MILSNQDIINRLGESVIISPFNQTNVNTSSYDVALGEWYYVEQKPRWWRGRTYNLYDFAEVQRVWGTPQHADRVILVPPGRTILAHTNEFIGGRYNVTSMMQARSSFGRNFIEVCKCAGYGDVGYYNRWTMEITNNSRFYRTPLVVGRRIAQIVFMETGEVEGRYDSKYQTALDVQDLKMSWRPEMMLPRLDLDREVQHD